MKAKTNRRALGWLELDRGKTYTAGCQTIQVTIPTRSKGASEYKESGLKILSDQPRSGHPVELEGTQRAKITAWACSTPPEGYAQWSLRLLAEKAFELEYCEPVSHTEVGQILKKTN